MASIVKLTLRSILMIIIGIVAMTCSDAIEEIPTPNGNNPPPVTGTISDDDRLKVLDE